MLEAVWVFSVNTMSTELLELSDSFHTSIKLEDAINNSGHQNSFCLMVKQSMESANSLSYWSSLPEIDMDGDEEDLFCEDDPSGEEYTMEEFLVFDEEVLSE